MKLWTTGEMTALVLKAEDEAERDERERVFARLIAAASGKHHYCEVEVYPDDVPGWSGLRPMREVSLVDWLREQQAEMANAD